MTVVNVLDYIESKSEFTFIYNNAMVDIDRTVTINLSDQPISKVLDKLFIGTDIEYTVDNKHIVLRDKNVMLQDKTITGNVLDTNKEPVIILKTKKYSNLVASCCCNQIIQSLEIDSW